MININGLISPIIIDNAVDIAKKLCVYNVDVWDDYLKFHIAGGDMPWYEKINNDMVDWINENTSGLVYGDDELGFDFELEKDAMAFKLRWA